jgi:HEAT repeat protein
MREDIKHNIAQLLTDPDPDIRRHAAEALGGDQGLAPIAALAAALKDPDKGVRDAVAHALCTIGGVHVAGAVVEYIADENITARNLAADILARLGNASLPALFPYLQDASEDVRKFSADILGVIRSEQATARLIPVLEDPDPNVSLSAVEALGNIGSPQAVPHLIRAYECFPEARAAVAEALGKIGDPASCDFLLRSLHDVLKNTGEDAIVAFTVIEALASIGNANALTVLQENLNDVDGKVKHVLLHAIVRIAERENITLPPTENLERGFIDALQDTDAAVQLSAVKGLAQYHDPDTTRRLVTALGLSEQVTAFLLPLLCERDEAFNITVEELSDSGTSAVREKIALLGKLSVCLTGNLHRRSGTHPSEYSVGDAFDAVASRWNAADEETRTISVDTLFHLDGDSAIEFFDNMMNDPDPWLRIHLIELLAGIEDRRVPDFVARFLEDDDEMVREVAMGTLQAKGYSIEEAES